MEHSAFPQSAAIKASQRTNVQAEKGRPFALFTNATGHLSFEIHGTSFGPAVGAPRFEALASTSAGYAFSAGKPMVHRREQMMMHIADLALPLLCPSARPSDGFGDTPEAALNPSPRGCRWSCRRVD